MCVYIIGGHNTDALEAFNDFGANWAWLSIEGEVWVIVGPMLNVLKSDGMISSRPKFRRT